MAATGTPTPNIGLRRPKGTDPASVDDINYNSNLIDTKLGAVGNTSVQEQINSLNSKINRTVLSSATNFNTLRATAGDSNKYYCGDNLALHSGIPAGTWTNNPFSLDVVSMGSYSVQILRVYLSTSGPKEYRRQTYYSSGETPYNTWTCIEDVLNSNLSYLDGSANSIADANNISKTGVYKAINSTAHTPASAHFVIYHMQFTTEEATQMAIATNGGKLYTRVYYNNAWSTWSEK